MRHLTTAGLLVGLVLGNLSATSAQNETLDPDSPGAKSRVTLAYDSLRAYAASTEMVYIEGGFHEGATVEPFYMDIHLVTLGQSRACVEAGVCPPPPPNDMWSDSWKKTNDRLPINNINWYNAQTSAAWVGKRLPTEAEWEWAAQGREEGRVYPWGNAEPSESSACWQRYDGDTDTGDGPCEVGVYARSRDGVYDLSGNLWERTSTYADESQMLLVLKGGAWYNDDATKLRVQSRGVATPYHRDASSDGIRLVVSASERERVFSLRGGTRD